MRQRSAGVDSRGRGEDRSHRAAAVFGPPDSVDAAVPWHFGDPHGEQQLLLAGQGAVDLSHRPVIRVTGPDRLSWLHDLTTAHLQRLMPGDSALALILDPHGHVQHELHLVDDGEATWISTEAGGGGPLVEYLRSMQFMLRVDVADVSDEYAVVWVPVRQPQSDLPTWLVPPEFAGVGVSDSGADRGGDAQRYLTARPAALVGAEAFVPRAELTQFLLDHGDPAGTWALQALRVAAAVPRFGFETDHKTLPHEVGWIGTAVHLSKGCYRGQETVARVHNMGRPPRRLVLAHLDGSQGDLPVHGDQVLLGDRVVGFVGTVVRHFELGPVATALVKRSVPADADLRIVSARDGTSFPAVQEVVIAC